MGKEKVIANEEKGQRGREKDAHLKTQSLTVCAGSQHGFSRKKQPKRSRGFCQDLPPPLTWFDVVLQGTPPPPSKDHVICVPSLSKIW